VLSHHRFTAVLGDRRGSDREDPLADPCWWRLLAYDPRCRRLVEFLDERFAEGSRFAVVYASQLQGPWRIYTYRDDACEWAWGQHDLGLADYERRRLMELWPDVTALEDQPPAGDAYGGWLVP
jgi:hypothetical protein